jgi:septum site-determining protein MinC
MSATAVVSASPPAQAQPAEACELKGSIAPLTVLRVFDPSVTAVLSHLRAQLAKSPDFFADTPVIVDLERLAVDIAPPFSELVAGLRALGLVPVAAQHVPPAFEELVRQAGLGLLRAPARASRTTRAVARDSRPAEASRGTADTIMAPSQPARVPATTPVRAPTPTPASHPAAAAAAPVAVGVGSLTRRTPVRGGQVVYARGRDLIVLAAVNPGAQVLADGSVHIYGTLRGQALAGATGDEQARIFVQSMNAELVAIAGRYLSADEIPKQHLGKAVQIYLEGDRCVVVPL